MKTDKIVNTLIEAAQQIGIEVRRERGRFHGGWCTIDGKELILLNKRQPVESHLAILADSLPLDRLESVFLPPAVRAALEESRSGKVDVS